MSFYGYDKVDDRIKTIYEKLNNCWSIDTCAPRYRQEWSTDNKTLGQCSITAFLVQDILGGKVLGIPLDGGGVHCINEVDGMVFDLTSEQFKGEALDYSSPVEQKREEHFCDRDKFMRYMLLKSIFEAQK